MKIRNIAIIAHVDHGKTTLVDNMLKQAGTFRENERVEERVMDSGDIERERGITISAKPTSIQWGEYKINIVDTPGHADFGGEVERILSMVDGVVLLVDSAEGPLPQTKFVLSKALKLGLRPIVCINKVDRADARPDEVLTETFDLFDKLGATDSQLDFPYLYSVGRDGWAVRDMNDEKKDLTPLFQLIVDHVPAPDCNGTRCQLDAPFRMLATTLEADPYVGRILTGKIESGTVRVGQPVKAINMNGDVVEQAKITKIIEHRGLEKVSRDTASAGDIVVVAGFSKATVADTLCDLTVTEPIPALPIDPPTLTMTFFVNTSPLAGRSGGKKLTSRMIGERLFKEAETNIALKVTQSANNESFEVSGRGELQLGILIETMRREGFELSVSRPRVVTHTDENGNILEPIEDVVIDVDDEFSGAVIEKMTMRKATITEMKPSGIGKTRIVFSAPSRGLIGYLSEFRTDTRGTGIMNRVFAEYGPYRGPISQYRPGVLVSMENGSAATYALFNLQPRGTLFIDPQTQVYSGMIIGEHSKENDLEVNPIKGKELTNMRSVTADEKLFLAPPRRMSLEEALSYIQDDELVEVTPDTIRLRKKELDSNIRKKMRKSEQ
ncbi:MAG: translational GTPase TypA [Alphaproteobacteria bacterium]|nr:translational GTPase TypA [Alphaproteobacteria bacterium]MDE6570674.1 translational GTPase TypA [Alphaproteobacteria bacterium]